jgi:anti-sigma B factor antagonist
MKLTHSQSNEGAVFISVEGELDLAATPMLREMLITAVEEDGRRPTTIDLAGCTFIDSSGLGVIVEIGRLLEQRRQTLRIVNLNAQPRELFELTQVAGARYIELEGDS